MCVMPVSVYLWYSTLILPAVSGCLNGFKDKNLKFNPYIHTCLGFCLYDVCVYIFQHFGQCMCGIRSSPVSGAVRIDGCETWTVFRFSLVS